MRGLAPSCAAAALMRRRYGSCAMRPGTDIRCFKRRLGRARSELARSRMRSPQPPQHAHRVPSQLCGAMCHSRNSASSLTAEKGAMHQSQCQHPNCPHWSNGSRSMVALERNPSLACRRRAHHLTTHAISIRHSISNRNIYIRKIQNIIMTRYQDLDWELVTLVLVLIILSRYILDQHM